MQLYLASMYCYIAKALLPIPYIFAPALYLLQFLTNVNPIVQYYKFRKC